MLICSYKGKVQIVEIDNQSPLLPVLNVVLTVDPATKLQTANLNTPGKVGKIGSTGRLQFNDCGIL